MARPPLDTSHSPWARFVEPFEAYLSETRPPASTRVLVSIVRSHLAHLPPEITEKTLAEWITSRPHTTWSNTRTAWNAFVRYLRDEAKVANPPPPHVEGRRGRPPLRPEPVDRLLTALVDAGLKADDLAVLMWSDVRRRGADAALPVPGGVVTVPLALLRMLHDNRWPYTDHPPAGAPLVSVEPDSFTAMLPWQIDTRVARYRRAVAQGTPTPWEAPKVFEAPEPAKPRKVPTFDEQ